MICFRCGKSIKGTGAKFIPTYRLTMLNIHLHEKCPKDKIAWNGIIQIIKVRDLAGFDNTKILNDILKFAGFDKKKFLKEVKRSLKK